MMDKKNKIYQTHKKIKEAISARKKIILWKLAGRPIPPPHIVKQKILKEYAEKYKLHTFIETGTFMGEMIDAMLYTFSKIISVEVDSALAERAQKKFFAYPHVTIILGDSGSVLPAIVVDIKESCLFWLDAHYSGGVTGKSNVETPIVQELNLLLNHSASNSIILIDDAREFTGNNNYPTLDEMRKLITVRRPDWVVQVKDDIIRIHRAGI
jgi:hypothetical protein